MLRKIVISGEGGQGVKLMAHVLAGVLAEFDNNVAIDYEYDAAVRGGNITAKIVYSSEQIKNPVIEDADVFLKLSRQGSDFKAKRMVCEKGVCTEEEIPFKQLALEQFKNPKAMNMIALGRLLKILEVNIDAVDLTKKLPSKFVEQNVEAIKYGYTYKDAVP